MRGKWRERRNEREHGGGEGEGKRTVEKEKCVKRCTIFVTDEPPKVASLHYVHLSLFTLPTITSTPLPMVC